MTTLISVSIKEYGLEHNDPNIDRLGFTIPFSMRRLPNTREELQMGNDFSPMLVPIPIRNDFKSTLPLIAKIFSDLKTTFWPLGMYYFLWVVCFLPSIIGFVGI